MILRMKILYFSFVELDIPNACQTHTIGILNGFSNNGCMVDAILPKPKYLRPKMDNIRFFYIWPWRFSLTGKSWLKCILFVRMIQLCTINSYDVIYIREMENNPAPRWCSWLFGIPLFVEVNDLLPEYYKNNGASRFYVHLLSVNQRKDFSHAAGIFVNSVSMGNWIKKEYPYTADKVTLQINGASEFRNLVSPRAVALKNIGLPPDSFTLGFIGTIYERFDFNTVLKAIHYLEKNIPNLHFVLIGDGPRVDIIKNKVAHYNLERRVHFTGYIEEEKLGNYVAAFDIALIPLSKKSTDLYGSLPTKFATYSMLGVPVVTTKSKISQYPKDIRENIFLYIPENRYSLSETILFLHKNKKLRRKSADKLKKYVSTHLTWNKVSQNVIENMKSKNITKINS